MFLKALDFSFSFSVLFTGVFNYVTDRLNKHVSSVLVLPETSYPTSICSCCLCLCFSCVVRIRRKIFFIRTNLVRENERVFQPDEPDAPDEPEKHRKKTEKTGKGSESERKKD